MPKKIATENINAKLGIVMKSGKALLGNSSRFICRSLANAQGPAQRQRQDGDCFQQLSQSSQIHARILLHALQNPNIPLYGKQH